MFDNTRQIDYGGLKQKKRDGKLLLIISKKGEITKRETSPVIEKHTKFPNTCFIKYDRISIKAIIKIVSVNTRGVEVCK